MAGVLYFDESHSFDVTCSTFFLVNNCYSTLFNGRGYISMTVGSVAFHCNEESTFLYFSGIGGNGSYLLADISLYFNSSYIIYYF